MTKKTTGFFNALKRLQLGTFASVLKKSVKIKSDRKVVQFSAQSDIFEKIALIQQIRQLDLKIVFYYPAGPVPWSLATITGELVNACKATLIGVLEKRGTIVERVQKSYAIAIHGMALVHKNEKHRDNF